MYYRGRVPTEICTDISFTTPPRPPQGRLTRPNDEDDSLGKSLTTRQIPFADAR